GRLGGDQRGGRVGGTGVRMVASVVVSAGLLPLVRQLSAAVGLGLLPPGPGSKRGDLWRSGSDGRVHLLRDVALWGPTAVSGILLVAGQPAGLRRGIGSALAAAPGPNCLKGMRIIEPDAGPRQRELQSIP